MIIEAMPDSPLAAESEWRSRTERSYGMAASTFAYDGLAPWRETVADSDGLNVGLGCGL